MEDNILITDFTTKDIFEILKFHENQYLEANNTDKEWSEKHRKIKKFLQEIYAKNQFELEDFDKLKSFALSKGGLLTNDLRRKLYKIVYCVDNKAKKYEFYYIDENKENYENFDVFEKKEESFDIKFNHQDLIEKDVNRSKINSIFNKKLGYTNTNHALKLILNKFINIMATINGNSYQYFQGYHDIGLHFLLLYLNEFEDAVSVFQRFSEFNLKENLSKFDAKCGYNFDKINDIVMDLLDLINIDVKKLISDHCDKPHFVFSWIITLFTHNLMNSFIQYRILDYFICSHPMSIYYLTTCVMIDEVEKISNKYSELVF